MYKLHNEWREEHHIYYIFCGCAHELGKGYHHTARKLPV